MTAVEASKCNSFNTLSVGEILIFNLQSLAFAHPVQDSVQRKNSFGSVVGTTAINGDDEK